MDESKCQHIKESLRTTKERHSSMNFRVFEVKVVSSKLNRTQKDSVNALFREAKWLRNAYIAGESVIDNTVPVKAGDTIEYRQLTVIGSQIKQSVLTSVKSEIKGLHTKKCKGETVGALKYKPVCNSVTLKQYGVTYQIDFDRNRIKVQNIKKPFYVRGLKQIPQDTEIANAKLVRKPSGLYFYITCFIPKEEIVPTGKMIGIDFGIKHNLTFNDGSCKDINVPESKAAKLASKRVNKSLKRNGNTKSRNHYKRVQALRRAYERNANRRKDAANKAAHDILVENDFIAIQDEMIHNWHSGLFGKQVQHSAMGYIKAKLKSNFKVYTVERNFPSTQICPVCGCLTKHPLSKRDYDCENCGYHHDSRDQKSAQSILDEALRQVSLEQRAQSPVETDSAMPVSLDTEHKSPSAKQEARSFNYE